MDFSLLDAVSERLRALFMAMSALKEENRRLKRQVYSLELNLSQARAHAEPESYKAKYSALVEERDRLVMEPFATNQTTGEAGEQLGEHFLLSRGYRILGRNVRTPFGEIDRVALDRGTLVFVEIKTRRSKAFGFPEEAVTRAKRRRLARLASWYGAMQGARANQPVRFDVLAIQFRAQGPSIRLIQNAFEASD